MSGFPIGLGLPNFNDKLKASSIKPLEAYNHNNKPILRKAYINNNGPILRKTINNGPILRKAINNGPIRLGLIPNKGYANNGPVR
eukprot:8590922-Pyramimonas_sp.AAC.1